MQFLHRHVRQRRHFCHFGFDQRLVLLERFPAETGKHVLILVVLKLPHGQRRTGQQHAAAQAVAYLILHRRHDARGEHRALTVTEEVDVSDTRVLHEQLCGVERVARVFVDDEYTRDALDAAALLMEDARIADLYLLGHSQGAMLAPRIMAAMQTEVGERLRGGVLLAGSPLPMWEIQYHQNLDVLKTLSGEALAQSEALVEAEVAKATALADMPAEELQKQTFFGINAYYQADEMSVDAAQTAVDLDLPLFIAQGEKDWQVRPADGVEAWQAKLPQDFDAVYKLYPDMTHMLFDLQGTPTGTAADYMAADARVSEALIEDIAAWIAAH